jgi:hypothetical protein
MNRLGLPQLLIVLAFVIAILGASRLSSRSMQSQRIDAEGPRRFGSFFCCAAFRRGSSRLLIGRDRIVGAPCRPASG